MKLKHRPAPWRQEGNLIRAEDGKIVAKLPPISSMEDIGTIEVLLYAPDMLKILERFVSAPGFEMRKIFEDAKLLISKVRGEA